MTGRCYRPGGSTEKSQPAARGMGHHSVDDPGMATSRYAIEPEAVKVVRDGAALDVVAAELVGRGCFRDYWDAWSWARRERLYASARRVSFARAGPDSCAPRSSSRPREPISGAGEKLKMTTIDRVNIYIAEDRETREWQWCYSAWTDGGAPVHDHNDVLETRDEVEARAQVRGLFPAAEIVVVPSVVV